MSDDRYPIMPIDEQPKEEEKGEEKPTSNKHAEYYNKSGNNAQQDGVNSLKRIEFEFQKKTYRFALNPEQLTQEEPNRMSVVQTKGGAWVDDFGGGLNTIVLKGTTGFKNTSGVGTDGFEKFKELRDLIRTYYFKQEPGTEVKEENELKFYNHTDGEAWIVVPKVFSLMRSVSRPLLYLYDIQLVAIRPANLPSYVFDSGEKVRMARTLLIENEDRTRVQKDMYAGNAIPPHSSIPIESTQITISPKVLTHQSLTLPNSLYVDEEENEPMLRSAYTADPEDAEMDEYGDLTYTGDESDGTPTTTILYSVNENLYEGYEKPEVPTEFKNAVYNLGEIIGDYAGRINSSTISVCTKDLTLIPPGISISGETIKAFGLNNSSKIPFTYTDFIPSISYPAYEVYTRLLQGGKDLLFDVKNYKNEVLSPLLIRMNTLPLELKLATQMSYLSIYALYIDLLTHMRVGCPISLTESDIKDILHNLDWLYNQVSCLDNFSRHINYMDTLMLAIRSVSFCREYDVLFTGNIKDTEGYITSNRCMPGYKAPQTILVDRR